jgi:hypothetical protein
MKLVNAVTTSSDVKRIEFDETKEAFVKKSGKPDDRIDVAKTTAF